jgi:nucleoside-diphosphate-sugar epimerase
MKVLVTGGGGFLGQAICRQLQQRGDTPIAFQRREVPALAASGIEQRCGDVRQFEALRAASAGCDAVIHTAGKAGAWGDPAEYHAINVQGTCQVIAACRAQGIQRLVFTSSPSVVHGGGDIENGDESLPYPGHFSAAYPRTKALAEQAVIAANSEQLHTVSLRPHLVWGPGDNQLLPRIIERARRGTLRLPGAHKLIDTVYIDNAAHAHILALAALDKQPACRGKAYFISNGEPWAQQRIIAALLAAVGVPAQIKPVPAGLAMLTGAAMEAWWRLRKREDEPPLTRWSAEQLCTAHWYNLRAAREELGYAPLYTTEQGLGLLCSAGLRPGSTEAAAPRQA